jgi:hypothetical protein
MEASSALREKENSAITKLSYDKFIDGFTYCDMKF